MLRIAPLALALCLLQGVHAQTAHHKGVLGDTVRIDVLLDSMSALIQAGRLEEALKSVPEVRVMIRGIAEQVAPPALLLREIKLDKLAGIAHCYGGEYPEALKVYQHMQGVARQAGDTASLGMAFSQESAVYRDMYDLVNAKAASRRAITTLRVLPPGPDLANAIMGLASVEVDEYHLDSAAAHQEEAVSILEKTGEGRNLGRALLNLAYFNVELGRNNAALENVGRARPLLVASGDAQSLMMLHGIGAKVLFRTKQYDAAWMDLAHADTLALALNDSESIGRIRDLQALIAARRDEPALAEQLLEEGRSALVKDLDLAKVEATTEVRMKAEQEQQQAEAASRLAQERARKRNALIGGGLLLAIAVLLARLLFVARRNETMMRAKNEEITKAHQQVVQAEKQREAEEVRTRIARDIHDEIGSGLTKIALLGNEAKFSMNVSEEALKTSLDRMISHSREVGAALSDIVWAVDPAADTMGALVGHAGHLAHRLLEHTGVDPVLTFNSSEMAQPVTPDLRHHVLMVMKEAINNALKYAHATRIVVELEAKGRKFALCVKDDGKGFDAAAKAGAGHGMRNMQARAEAIGARFTIESAPGQGCTVRLEGEIA